MFDSTERYYDAIYDTFKDYQGESEQLHDLIRLYKRSPGNSLLDVACGTGRHLSYLRQDYEVEGLDLDEVMLAVAAQRNPGVRLHHASMVDFQLARRFDVIVCLFSSIGYVQTLPRLQQAIQTMANHLQPGGVLILEPWLTPEAWQPGQIGAVFVDQPEFKVARMNTSEVRDGLSIMHFHYLIATSEGIEHLTETHEMGLFSHEDYLHAFELSSLTTVYDPDPHKLSGRGIYIGNNMGKYMGNAR